MSGVTQASSPVTPSIWERAIMAIVAHLIVPQGTGGIRLRSHAGPVRDAWLAILAQLIGPSQPLRRVPADIGDDRLLGGLDLAATLQARSPVAEKGLLAEAHGGFVILAMAERIDISTAAKITQVMDTGEVLSEGGSLTLANAAQFGVIALDEGIDEEQPPSALTERLGLVVDLRSVTHRDIAETAYTAVQIQAARASVTGIVADESMIEALCSTSAVLGISGVRAPLQALYVARAAAALSQRQTVCDDDVTLAAMLVLAPRATQVPATESQDNAGQQEPQDNETEDAASQTEETPPPVNDAFEKSSGDPAVDNAAPASPPSLEDLVLDAALASIPLDLLKAMQERGAAPPARSVGKSGQIQKQMTRGRRIGSKPGHIRGGARLDVIATLRRAAPWQKLRQSQQSTQKHQTDQPRIFVSKDDFHIVQYRQRAQTTTIFVVDASGSSALQRLAEAKGAVRLLLAESYVRRDEVALIAFRGIAADVILPPTRSLVRAQRALSALPGGGGTPIAAGIDAAHALAVAVQRSGRTPTLVIMTDGRANVRRNGLGGRPEAQEEARDAARRLRLLNAVTILIDTSPKPQPLASELALLMGARYVPLPNANAERVAQTVQVIQASAGETPVSTSQSRGVA